MLILLSSTFTKVIIKTKVVPFYRPPYIVVLPSCGFTLGEIERRASVIIENVKQCRRAVVYRCLLQYLSAHVRMTVARRQM